MLDFYLLEIWKLRNKLFYVLLQTFPQKYFPKIMVHFCQTRMNGVAGPMVFLKDLVPQLIHLGNTQAFLAPQNTMPTEGECLIKLAKDQFLQLHQ